MKKEKVILRIRREQRSGYEGWEVSIVDNNNNNKYLIFISSDYTDLRDREYLERLKGIILEALDIEDNDKYYVLEHLFDDYFILYKDYKKLMMERLNSIYYKVGDIIDDMNEGYDDIDKDLTDILNLIEKYMKEV